MIGVFGEEECCMKANNYTMQMVDTAGTLKNCDLLVLAIWLLITLNLSYT